MIPDAHTPKIVMEAKSPEYTALRATILRQLNQLDQLSTERSIFKEQATNILENDDKYQELDEKAKEARREATLQKKNLMMTDASVKLKVKITDKTADIREVQESLSENLVAYRQMTGISMIEDEDGQERSFSIKASVKPKQLSLFKKEGV